MLTDFNIKKHVIIIHAYSMMSALQRKIANVLFFEATKTSFMQPSSEVVNEYRLPLATLLKSLNFKSNNTQYLKEAIDTLASIKIEWNLLKDKAPSNISFLNLRVLQGSPTFYKDHTFTFSFHKVLLSLINNPLIYGTIDMDIQSQFESRYSHALYENSTRFVNLKKNKIISLDIFRKLLGIDENKYKNMKEFTRTVLNPALEEVNDRADFTIQLDNIKTGRKITGFNLEVNNKKFSVVKTESNATTNPIIDKITENFGTVHANLMDSLLKNYSDAYLQEKIAYVKKYSKKDATGFYPVAYFISALKNDYKSKEKNSAIKNPIINIMPKDTLNQKISYLQADLNHWHKMLDYAKQMNNTEQIDIIKKVIANCESKLRNEKITNGF